MRSHIFEERVQQYPYFISQVFVNPPLLSFALTTHIPLPEQYAAGVLSYLLLTSSVTHEYRLQ